jgi:hypothetical protein
MSRGLFKKPSYVTTGGWSGLAAPVIAGAAVHSTAPWYFAIPAVVLVVAVAIWRRRGGGGPPGRGPFGGS